VTEGSASNDRGSGSDPFLRAVASAPSRPPPGADDNEPERIAHFRVLGRLGHGGMGIVYRAEDEKLRRTVALKVLPRAFAKDEERRRRFLREARSGAAIAHANIATVYEVDEADGRIFLAMELVEGETLRARIARGALPVAEAVRIARGIARGLARAHAKGVVHRDLKPDNVMIDGDGEPKILDFGLAKLREAAAPAGGPSALEHAETAGPATEEGRLLGTPQYMAPEQGKGAPTDARSDVFSFGLVLYEMCAGRRAFQGATSLDVLMAIARDPHEPLRRRVPEATPGLEAVVDRCLAKAPADRYADAGEVAAALDALVSSGSTRSHANVALSPEARTESSRGRLAALVAAVGLASVGVLLASHLMEGPAPGLPPPVAPLTSSSAASSGSHAITDWPPPATPVHEAAAAYASGLQALRDGSQAAAIRHLARALELDSHIAEAHLRLALLGGEDDRQELVREHVAAAEDSRASLSPRDLELLDLARALLRHSTDSESTGEKARALAVKHPDDAEMLFWVAHVLSHKHVDEEGFALLDHALAVDPHFAAVEHMRALARFESGDAEGALAAAARCLEISPTAASCLRRRADVHDARGECSALEQDAKQLLTIEPSGTQGYGYLMAALAAQGAPVEALQQLSRKAVALRSGTDARRAALDDGARLAVYTGDFAAAESSMQSFETEATSSPDESEHLALVWLTMLYEEEGASAKAVATADDFLRKLPAWLHEYPNGWRAEILAVLRRAGRIPEARAKELGDAWMQQAVASLGPYRKNDVWTVGFAFPAQTPAEARAALDLLPAWSPLPDHRMIPGDAGAVGHAYALAGDADRAIPLLRQESAWCGPVPAGTGILGLGPSLRIMQDRFLLGQALEQKGDRDGACAEYSAVLARWGNAKPRSVTADKARARSRALACH
jgi:serine/threonine-protein kinase